MEVSRHGGPPKWMVYKGTSENQLDDDWGDPPLWKPKPYRSWQFFLAVSSRWGRSQVVNCYNWSIPASSLNFYHIHEWLVRPATRPCEALKLRGMVLNGNKPLMNGQ